MCFFKFVFFLCFVLIYFYFNVVFGNFLRLFKFLVFTVSFTLFPFFFLYFFCIFLGCVLQLFFNKSMCFSF
jgi:hypothetical protein